MTRTIISRLTGVSAVVLTAAVLAASGAGATGGGGGAQTAPPDSIERTVAAHPYGEGVLGPARSQRERDTWFRDALGEAPTPDAVDRALVDRAHDLWFSEVVVSPDAVDRAVAARARESLAAAQETAAPVGAPVLDSGSTSTWTILGAFVALGLVALLAATLLVSASARRKSAQTA